MQVGIYTYVCTICKHFRVHVKVLPGMCVSVCVKMLCALLSVSLFVKVKSLENNHVHVWVLADIV